MKIAVVLKQGPDLVEELEVDDSGTGLDMEYAKLKLNEFDEHALEEALLIKEASGAEVVALAAAGEDVERVLFTALAKGADSAIKVGGVDAAAENSVLAPAFSEALQGLEADLVLTGVQSVSDRDGQLAPILAASMNRPAVSVVTGVRMEGGKIVLKKEYTGGMMAEFEVDPPAVLGIQAASQAPRYAPVSKVRQVQQSASLQEITVTTQAGGPAGKVLKMEPPLKGQGAVMLSGAGDLVGILKEKGVL